MSYQNPDTALKHILELKIEGRAEDALEELHLALHGKKFKGNNVILERIVVSRGIIKLLKVKHIFWN